VISVIFITDIQAKKTPNKQKGFGDASLSCFDEFTRGPNMDKESAESSLRRFTILGSVRRKSLDNKVTECKDTCTFNGEDVTMVDEGIDTSGVIIGTSTCYKTSSENSELGSRNIHAVDSSLNTDNAVSLKMNSSDPISIKGSPDSPFLNSETHISSSNISLVSHDYNFSCSDESSS
jgi:hypothetical protein